MKHIMAMVVHVAGYGDSDLDKKFSLTLLVLMILAISIIGIIIFEVPKTVKERLKTWKINRATDKLFKQFEPTAKDSTNSASHYTQPPPPATK